KNLRFKPDSAELLPEENARLFALAQGLKQIQNKRFLVVGHTADVGNPVGQKRLSLERAKAIVEALIRLGVPKDRFLYEGRGAEEPVASNANEVGRAQNRRVEITLLED
ncbi:MAG: OmpA family protein, partial [Spirochaetes bacterium]|nr:OmpA family protein [Spirochaetota bacterium]